MAKEDQECISLGPDGQEEQQAPVSLTERDDVIG